LTKIDNYKPKISNWQDRSC